MRKTILSMSLTLVIIFVVPFPIYALFSVILGLEPPAEASPAVFFLSVLVQKVGHAIVFVSIFYFARNSLSGRWLLYAFLWWVLFAVDEFGQAIGPRYSLPEAIAGVISEAIYFPLSAYVTTRLIGVK